MEVQEWQKGGFYSRLASNKITTRGYMVLTFAKCTTIMIAELAVTNSHFLSPIFSICKKNCSNFLSLLLIYKT
jgi:hypothetical protein